MAAHPLPDHGVQEYDADFVGGDYATAHPRFYANTMLGPVPKNPEHPDFDMLASVIPRAKDRGIASYAWMEESSYTQAVRAIPTCRRRWRSICGVGPVSLPVTRPTYPAAAAATPKVAVAAARAAPRPEILMRASLR